MYRKIKSIVKILIILAFIYISANLYIVYNYPIKYEKVIDQVASETKVDKSLILAIIRTESGFDTKAISKKNALGLMQVIPETIQFISQKYNIEIGINDIFNPTKNIEIGSYYIKNLTERFGSTERAILAYNAGPSVVKRWIDDGLEDPNSNDYEWVPYEETRNYIKKVNKYRKGYSFFIDTEYRVPQTLQDYFLDFFNSEEGFIARIKDFVKGFLK